jgi:hypothetical protein
MNLRARLAATNIVNTHDLLRRFGRESDVAVSFCGTDNSRGGRAAHTQVWKPGHKTDPAAHWRDYGNKTFLGSRGESLPAAKAWAEQNYTGPVVWVPSPVLAGRGCYVPEQVVERAKAAVREGKPK